MTEAIEEVLTSVIRRLEQQAHVEASAEVQRQQQQNLSEQVTEDDLFGSDEEEGGRGAVV